MAFQLCSQAAALKFFLLATTGVTVGLTQSLVKAFEDEGAVQVCAELEKGQLGTNLSLYIETDSGNESGIILFVNVYGYLVSSVALDKRLGMLYS